MDKFTQEDFDLVSQCLEVAFKVEAQRVPMEQAAQAGAKLAQVRARLKALVEAPELKKVE